MNNKIQLKFINTCFIVFYILFF